MQNSLTREQKFHRDLTADTLRGTAILMVIVLHAFVMTIGLLNSTPLIEIVNRLASGVQIFFVVSGYVITESMDRTTTRGEGGGSFIIRRAAKLFPLYIIFLNLNIIFFVFWNEFSPNPIFYRNSVTAENLSWSGYAIHLAMLQGIFPNLINTYVDGAWSIVCEAYFYILVPIFLYRLTRTIAGAIWALLATLVLAIGFSFFAKAYLSGLGYYSYYAFPAQLPCFLLGVVCYRLREQFRVALPLDVQAATACVVLVLFAGFARIETAPLGGHIAIAILAALALFSIRITICKSVLGLVQRIGRMSYALFLSHILILKIAYSTVFANGFQGSPGLAFIINLSLALFAAGALSYAIFDPLDRYCVNLTNRILDKRRAMHNEITPVDFQRQH